MHSPIQKSRPAVAVLGLVILLTGCAGAITREALVPDTIDATVKHTQSVSVNVSGAESTRTRITNETFAEALVDSINKSKIFSKALQEKGGEYILEVTFVNFERPTFAASVTIKMEAAWRLKRADNSSVVWQESIKSEHTATMSDAMVGATRWKMAEEGTARNNIRAGLDKIGKLNF